MSGFNYSHNGLTMSSRPGAWMYDGAAHAWPIFNSGDLTDVTNSIYTHNGSYPPLNNTDDAWAVLPGFKLELFFNGDNGGSKYTLDNTDGATYLTKKNEDINSSFARNQISSVRLYYKGTELKTIAPNFAISGVYSVIQGPTYSFIYILGDSSFNYSGSEAALTDISMLIVGGGGSGGRDHGYSGAGGGGGGEVGIGSITITANQDYSIYIGDGGTFKLNNYATSDPNSITQIITPNSSYHAYGGGQGAGDYRAGSLEYYDSGDVDSVYVGSGGGGSGFVTYPNRQPGGNGGTRELINGITYYANNGGNGISNWGGGGGGGAGSNGSTTNQWRGGSGGNGIQWLDSSGGDGRYYGGGGAGIRDEGNNDTSPKGGKGGGGGMSSNGYDSNYGYYGSNGAPNTGGGGSGRQRHPFFEDNYISWAGGSGVVVFRVTNAQLDS